MMIACIESAVVPRLDACVCARAQQAGDNALGLVVGPEQLNASTAYRENHRGSASTKV
jgi:hypothetical protein